MRLCEEIMEKQKEEGKEGYVVLQKSGIFVYAVGKDAVILADLFCLKLRCIKKGVCQISISEKSLERYIEKLIAKRISVVIYERNETKLVTLFRSKFDGIYEESQCRECENCDQGMWKTYNRRMDRG